MPRLVRGVARTAVVAGTATAVSNRVSRRQANRWADQGAAEQPYPDQASEPQSAPVPAPVAPAATNTSSMLDQLKELGELHTAGILTDAEFETQKARILAG
jgi:Short C-terminal domain